MPFLGEGGGGEAVKRKGETLPHPKTCHYIILSISIPLSPCLGGEERNRDFLSLLYFFAFAQADRG